MPLFDNEQIRDLAGDQASADHELDLRGVATCCCSVACRTPSSPQPPCWLFRERC